MINKFVLTDDGSSSIYSEDVKEFYHSRFGALQESMHIFINAGLCYEKLSHLKHISVLEIGFGTGLNAWLTYYKAQELQKKVYYETLELYPLSLEEIDSLNYPSILQYEDGKEIFHALHRSKWNEIQQITDNFILHKRQISTIHATYLSNTFNLVYFDAFSPEVQPDMWTRDMFESIYCSMKNGSILLTYCTKGIVRKTVTAVGFVIEKLPGPIGKREILRAIKV